MANDGERPYTVLTRDEVKEKMKKQIAEISEIFLVSESDVTVLLMYRRWDSVRVSEGLSEDKEKLLAESGLKSFVTDSNQDLISDVCCGVCGQIGDEFYEIVNDDGNVVDGDVVDDDLISTPFCSHKFCKTCWSGYLEKNVFSVEKNKTGIPCPHPDCRAVVGPDTIEKLSVRDQEMYEEYILRSYREEKLGCWKIKQCPAPGCNYEIEYYCSGKEDDEHSLNVVCLCGHIFCWRCMLESHRPVTCNNASDWLSRDLKNLLEESESSLSWIEDNTKSCPHCSCPVLVDAQQWTQFVTCVCSGRFCWRCFGTEEAHKPGLFRACVEKNLGGRAKAEISCLDHWEASQVSLEQAKFDLEAFEKSKIKNPTDLEEQDYKVIREGLMLIVQCRQFLKWSSVYDYLHTEYDMAKREYLRYLQEKATALVQSYSETIKESNKKAKERCWDTGKVLSDTSNIGNYFYHFNRTLRAGLGEVKVSSYNNYGGQYWLCDRCRYGNSWFQKACKMCCDPTAVNEDELSDLSSN